MSKLKELFGEGRWQALVPGWNIVYLLKYGSRMTQKWEAQDKELREAQEEGQGLQMIVNHYAAKARQAEHLNDYVNAKNYHAQARAEIAQYFEDHRESIMAGFKLMMAIPEFRQGFTKLYGPHLDDFLRDNGITEYLD
jgi:hypothetical protein